MCHSTILWNWRPFCATPCIIHIWRFVHRCRTVHLNCIAVFLHCALQNVRNVCESMEFSWCRDTESRTLNVMRLAEVKRRSRLDGTLWWEKIILVYKTEYRMRELLSEHTHTQTSPSDCYTRTTKLVGNEAGVDESNIAVITAVNNHRSSRHSFVRFAFVRIITLRRRWWHTYCRNCFLCTVTASQCGLALDGRSSAVDSR